MPAIALFAFDFDDPSKSWERHDVVATTPLVLR